jgi:thiol-disulfide isomerase/thioredoxin
MNVSNLFKQQWVPYVLFALGVALIFCWARLRSSNAGEGFENNGLTSQMITASPYNFEMYYVDWCPHCVTAKPQFEKLGAIKTIAGTPVACKMIEAEKNPEMVRGKVNGYPTFQLYDAAGKLVDEYSGSRTTAGFQSFLEDSLNRSNRSH